MKEQSLIKKIENQAAKFKKRAAAWTGDEKRHDRIRPDEMKCMWTARNELGWSDRKIGSVFDRDPRSVKQAVQSFEQQKETPSVARKTRHEEQLQAMINHLVKSLTDLSSFTMPGSPESAILPYEGQIVVADIRIENDPVFGVLMEHLKDTQIPMLWEDAEVARREYFVAAAARYSIEPTNPEFVHEEQEEMNVVRNRREELWQRYCELTFSLWQKLRELLLADGLPGKCHLCAGN